MEDNKEIIDSPRKVYMLNKKYTDGSGQRVPLVAHE